ncbi:MAG: hypothetical protein QM214_00145 [Bacillota bacterium]|nr:hypothetical protein [Bacillota bacterium]HHU43732.1 hypothetical protein [Clostridiales bacterium]
MRRYYRNWITYDQAFGKRVCVPHAKKEKDCLCRDMMNLLCKHCLIRQSHRFAHCNRPRCDKCC